MFDRTPQRPLPPPRLDPPQLQYSRTSTINAPGGGDTQEVCRLGLQTLTLFEVQLFIPLPCLRQQSLFNVPDSFRSHSGLNNFQTNITKWASLNRVTKIHVRLSRLRGVKQKRSHWDSGTNNSSRNQVWILVIQNWPIRFFEKKNRWYYKCKPLIANQPLHSFRDSGFPVKWRLRNQCESRNTKLTRGTSH